MPTKRTKRNPRTHSNSTLAKAPPPDVFKMREIAERVEKHIIAIAAKYRRLLHESEHLRCGAVPAIFLELLGLKWACNICEDCFWKHDQMVKHWRAKHPGKEIVD